jgi:hypothetical protein
VDIKIKEYYYKCAEGCCEDWGVDLTIDGNDHGSFAGDYDALEHVLVNVLGHSVEYEYDED